MSKYVLPLLLSLLFILENIYVSNVSPTLLGEKGIIVPHFLFFGLLFMTLYYNPKKALIYGVIFGVIYDIVYTEIIGIYLAAFPLFIFLISQAMKILYANLFIRSILVLIWTIALEYLVYGLNILFGYTNMLNSYFINHRLFPTLLLNALFILIFAFPLSSLLRTISENNEEK